MSEISKGYMAGILMAFIIGLSFLFSKIALNYADSFTILIHRFLIASLCILPFGICKKEDLKLNKNEFKFVLKMAFIYPVLIFSTQIFGLNFIDSALAGAIQSIQPLIITLLGAIILNEKTSKSQNIALCISSLGCILIFASKFNFRDFSQFNGCILIFISCFFISLYAIISRKNRNNIDSFKLTFYCLTFGTIIFLAFYLIKIIFFQSEDFFKPFSHFKYNVAIFYIAVLSSLLTLVLTNFAYKRVEAYKIGILNNLAPAIAIIAGILVLNENISSLQIIGIFLIFLGIIGVNLKLVK